MKYPTGVENHGGKLRIWFVYKGVRVREILGVPDTAKNRRVAGELRASVCYAIKTGVFDYAKQFPSSRNLEKFGETRQDLTIKELAEKFLALKETEVAKTSLTPIAVGGSVGFREAETTIVCRKIYKQDFDTANMPKSVIEAYYQTEAPHTMYMGEVLEIIEKK